MSEIPAWKRADLIALGADLADLPAEAPEPKKERAVRKPAMEKAVQE